MSIPNFSPETQAAIDLLFGESDTSATAAEAASPIAQAVATAAQQLQHVHEGELESKRLAEAMQLVLGNGVALHLDGSSTVQKGRAAYSQQDGQCSCHANRNKNLVCEHLLAAELQQLTQGLLSGEPAQVPAATPASAAWDVHEAPVSCYLKFRVGHLELSYTMRDVDDDHLSARLAKVLPKVHAMAEAEEARRQHQAAERAAAKPQAQAGRREPAAEATDLQQMIEQAVQHALAGQAAQNGNGAKPPTIRPTADGQAERFNADGDKWCVLHEAWMPERSNDNGSWHSHPAEDEQGEYYCKGNGRPRRNRR